jgi:uncharacterized protein YndB with AHSA1/START domain
MTVSSVTTDPVALTMTIVANFNESVERVWELWSNPRLLERWWGPPTYPATMTLFEFVPGGKVSYFMSGPAGEVEPGWWQFTLIEAPHRIEFDNGIADEGGLPRKDMPSMKVRVALDEAAPGTTRMVVETQFPSTEAMEIFLTMGMKEGLSSAIGQMDVLFA